MPSFCFVVLLPTGRKIPDEALLMQENRGKLCLTLTLTTSKMQLEYQWKK